MDENILKPDPLADPMADADDTGGILPVVTPSEPETPKPEEPGLPAPDAASLQKLQDRTKDALEGKAPAPLPPPAVSPEREKFQLRLIQEFPEALEDGLFSHMHLTKLAELVQGGYTGDDIEYRAAAEAAADPRVAKERNEAKARDRRVETASRFEKPTPGRREETEDLALTPGQIKLAERWALDLNDPVTRADFKRNLQEQAAKLPRGA